MQSTFSHDHGIGVVTLAGILSAGQVDGLRRRFSEWLQGEWTTGKVVVDMSAVELIDSAGLGLLIAMLKQMAARGDDLKLAGLRKAVRMVFEMTRMHRIFEVFDSVDEAIGKTA